MISQFLGAHLQAAQPCLLWKENSTTTDAQFATNTIVSAADASTIEGCPVLSTESATAMVKTIRNLKSLYEVPSSNNAPSASSGLKEWKGVVPWPVDAGTSFAMTVAVATARMACASMEVEVVV